jgi:hypothetical protein
MSSQEICLNNEPVKVSNAGLLSVFRDGKWRNLSAKEEHDLAMSKDRESYENLLSRLISGD